MNLLKLLIALVVTVTVLFGVRAAKGSKEEVV